MTNTVETGHGGNAVDSIDALKPIYQLAQVSTASTVIPSLLSSVGVTSSVSVSAITIKPRYLLLQRST